MKLDQPSFEGEGGCASYLLCSLNEDVGVTDSDAF